MTEPSTVVVASRNRPRQLRECLARLVALDHPDCRIIVVDDGSREPVAPLASAFGSRVTVIRQENAGPAAARNRGVEAAETDFIAFTDDDCRPAPDWLAKLQAAHRADPEALVGGCVVNELEDSVFSAASQSIVDFLYHWHATVSDRLRFFTTNNVGFSRRAFRKVGMLDPSFVFASEDRDLGLRWRASGRRLVYVPEAVVGHSHALTLRDFWRQHASYGRGARRLHVKLGHRLEIEPLRFYLGLLSHPMLRPGRASAPAAAAQAALILLSQVATTGGYLAERLAERSRPPRAGRLRVDATRSSVHPGGQGAARRPHRREHCRTLR